MNRVNTHENLQKQVISEIEKQIKNESLSFSTVAPVDDYKKDKRICLTSVHFPNKNLISKIQSDLIFPLQNIQPQQYFYPPDSLHMTIKNIRLIKNPPNFNQDDILKAQKIFSEVITSHRKFKVYFYRLLLFPSNLALIGTTDPELDAIILDLDKRLNQVNLSDDKKYINEKYFFSNITLARFTKPVSREFKIKVLELSNMIDFVPYQVDSVSLVSGTAVLGNKKIIETWNLV